MPSDYTDVCSVRYSVPVGSLFPIYVETATPLGVIWTWLDIWGEEHVCPTLQDIDHVVPLHQAVDTLDGIHGPEALEDRFTGYWEDIDEMVDLISCYRILDI